MPVQAASTHTTMAGPGFFEMALRFGLKEPCETAHIYLTALARVAQCTGVYARGLVALMRSGALTIISGMTTAMRDLAVRAADDACYTQIINPV